MLTKDGKQIAEKLLSFINASDTQFHAVYEASKRLLSAGFTQLSERQPWQIKPGGKASLAAFCTVLCCDQRCSLAVLERRRISTLSMTSEVEMCGW
jgi:hypothetical protein